MASLLIRILRPIVNGAKSWMLASDWGRSLLSDTKNVGTFSQVSEHENMLADRVRVDGYQAAIERHINAGDTVIDLGTGTGILSFLAAQQSPKKIYAIDHSPMLDVAKKVARANGIEGIEFVQANSQDFSPDEKVDVILHEQIGEGLFNENMIDNLLDLKRRTLKATGTILPGEFELYLEPVTLREDHRVPSIWENKLHGINFECLRDDDAMSGKVIQHSQRRFLEQAAVEQFLCVPEPAFHFDLNKMNDDSSIPKRLTLSKAVKNPGPVDGVCIYLRIIFDETLGFDTSPFSTRTNWSTSFYRVPQLQAQAGQTIELDIDMSNLVDVDKWAVSASISG